MAERGYTHTHTHTHTYTHTFAYTFLCLYTHEWNALKLIVQSAAS